jgi:P27 family predicted phage terminase small subunit
MLHRPKPPKDLTPGAKRLWQRIFAEVELDSPAVLLLNTLCEAWDRLQEARALLARDGIVVKDRFQQDKPHPACAIERDAAATMTRCWRLLGFDQQPADEIGMPPTGR